MRTAFCFDMDGTITRAEVLPCIASELGISEEMDTLTRLTMAGMIPFDESLRLRALILGQVAVERIHSIVSQIPLDPWIEAFIASRPDDCFVVTGNLDVWITPMLERLPCRFHSTRAVFAEGRIKLEHILDKGQAVSEIRASGLFERVIAVGDGANDVPMFKEADIGIAFGGIHSPTPSAIQGSQFVCHSGEVLCSLLKAL